jgi:hypothetical protein
MATESDLKQIITNNDGGRWIGFEGPFQIGTGKVYEIWTRTTGDPTYLPVVRKGDIPQTRFWLEDKNGPKYFPYFSELAAHFAESKSAGAPADMRAPADMSIGQLMGALKPVELWVTLGFVGTVILAAFWFGVFMAPLVSRIS